MKIPTLNASQSKNTNPRQSLWNLLKTPPGSFGSWSNSLLRFGEGYRIPLHRSSSITLKDRLIANNVAKWKKARPELFPDSSIAARDVLPGENWIFPHHRTLAEVIDAERNAN